MTQFPISKNENRDLMMYYFIVVSPQPNVMPPPGMPGPVVKEEVLTILSYDMDSALNESMKAIQSKPGAQARLAGNKPVKDILQYIEKGEEEKKPEAKALTMENFKYSLMLAADKYVEDDQDKVTLKAIIEKIKV